MEKLPIFDDHRSRKEGPVVGGGITSTGAGGCAEEAGLGYVAPKQDEGTILREGGSSRVVGKTLAPTAATEEESRRPPPRPQGGQIVMHRPHRSAPYCEEFLIPHNDTYYLLEKHTLQNECFPPITVP